MTRIRFTIRSLGVVLVLALMFAGWQADTDSAWAGYERLDGEPARLLADLDRDTPILPLAAVAIPLLERAQSLVAHPPQSVLPARATSTHPIRGSPGMHRS